MSLMKAVNKGCSGTYKKCLLACLFPTSEVTLHGTLKMVLEGGGVRDGNNCCAVTSLVLRAGFLLWVLIRK